MKTEVEKPCYLIADQTVCRGDYVIIKTTAGETHGRLVSVGINYIVVDILQSRAVITKSRIVQVIIK